MAPDQSLSIADGLPSEAFQDLNNQAATSQINEVPSNSPATRRGRADSSSLIGPFEAFPNLGEGSTSTASPQSPRLQETSTATAPLRRGRARSATLVGATNPLECPVSATEQQVANLVRNINRANQRTAPLPTSINSTPIEVAPRVEAAVPVEASRVETPLTRTQDSEVSPDPPTESDEKNQTNSASSSRQSNTAEAIKAEAEAYYSWIKDTAPADNRRFPPWEYLIQNRPSPLFAYPATFGTQVRHTEDSLPEPELFDRLQKLAREMNSYQNYLDSPGAGPSPNPRQAPPSPSQGMHQNGMNGGMGLSGGMVGFPTPAGHQSDLNYIMQMVEELAGQLAHNQGLTAGIVDKMGKVRAKAKNQELSNDELLAIAASELNVSSENLEKENSELRKALDKAVYEKKENWKLAIHGANILSDILDKMHKFKAIHEADTLAWHRNYRKQLADEREENLNLRNQINDMKAAACRANEHLRQMRRYLTDHDELNELRIRNVQLRQERRLWKRMALPLIPQDDSEWSDDDDIIDPEEKKRLAAEKAEKERKDKEGEGEGAAGATA